MAWLQTPREKGGIEGVTYPLVADASKTIAANYDVLGGRYDYNEAGEMVFVGSPVAYRGLFLIDKDGIVRHQVVNDGHLGRNVDEALRMIDALQHYETSGEACPVNWKPGQEAITNTKEGLAKFFGARHA
jgi:peroxiredoxin (alkyl hydroperoxide reductase subunit C)